MTDYYDSYIHVPWVGTRAYNRMEYYKYKLKQFIFQMLIVFAIRPHWVRYQLIYNVQSRCLPSLVDIYMCLFGREWLGTPVQVYVQFL